MVRSHKVVEVAHCLLTESTEGGSMKDEVLKYLIYNEQGLNIETNFYFSTTRGVFGAGYSPAFT